MVELNKIYLGDCIEVMANIPNNSVDMVITSPPYNVELNYATYKDDMPYEKYLKWCEEWISLCVNKLKSGGRIAINVPIENNVNEKIFICNDYMNILNKCGLLQMAFILWNKNHVTSRTAWGSWLSPSSPCINQPMECILVYAKDSKKREINKDLIDITDREFIDWTLGIWNIQPAKSSWHPAPFPIELPIRLLKMFTCKKDTILEPFSGTGTVACACAEWERNFIAIEKDEQYYKNSLERLKGYQNQMRLF